MQDALATTVLGLCPCFTELGSNEITCNSIM